MRPAHVRLIAALITITASGPCFAEVKAEKAAAPATNRLLSTAGTGSLKDAATVATRYGSVPGNGATVKSSAGTGSLKDANTVATRYGSVPGGVALEGTAHGLPAIRSIAFDAKSGALMLPGRLIYRPNLPWSTIASLARAVSEDDRVGVSLTEDDAIVYGSSRLGSDIARDLMLADAFLADFVLPPREWTVGYKLPSGFEMRAPEQEQSVAVFFRLHEFGFSVRGQELKADSARVDVLIFPVATTYAADGGFLPDYDALSGGTKLDAYTANAAAVSQHIGYFSGERIVQRALALGEMAAVLRSAKAGGANLVRLAQAIEAKHGRAQAFEFDIAQAWKDYLGEVQAAGAFENWEGPPRDLYDARTLTTARSAALKR